MSSLLERVAAAAAVKQEAEQAVGDARAGLVRAVVAARPAHTLQEIASVLGVSRQFVHELTQKEER
jgi:hypothetical protein